MSGGDQEEGSQANPKSLQTLLKNLPNLLKTFLHPPMFEDGPIRDSPNVRLYGTFALVSPYFIIIGEMGRVMRLARLLQGAGGVLGLSG